MADRVKQPGPVVRLVSYAAELGALGVAHDDVIPAPVEADLSHHSCPRRRETVDVGEDPWPPSLEFDVPTPPTLRSKRRRFFSVFGSGTARNDDAGASAARVYEGTQRCSLLFRDAE